MTRIKILNGLLFLISIFIFTGCSVKTSSKNIESTKLEEVYSLVFPIIVNEIENKIKENKNAKFVINLEKYPLLVRDIYKLTYSKDKSILVYHGDTIPFSYVEENYPDSDKYENNIKKINENSIVIKTSENFSKLEFNENVVLRVGDKILGQNLVGNIEVKNGMIHFSPDTKVSTININKREFTPKKIEGNLKIASFNVLNLFKSMNTYENCMEYQKRAPRGANDDEEYRVQKKKIKNAIKIIDADLIGIVEVQNDFDDNSSINDLVSELNEIMPNRKYVFVRVRNNQIVSKDVIATGIIYDSNKIKPMSELYVLSEDMFSRHPIFMKFKLNNDDFRFVISVNHFKSMSRGNPSNDGRGNSAEIRTRQSELLIDFINTNFQGEKILLLGDYNSYQMSEAMQNIINNGFTNLNKKFDENSYTYIHKGFKGTLDYAFANKELESHIKGTYPWNINSAESAYRDYNTNPNRCKEDRNNRGTFYFTNYPIRSSFQNESTPYRSSDHDPVIVNIKTDL